MYGAIAASSDGAVVQAVIGIDLIAVVAFLGAGMNESITTTGAVAIVSTRVVI